MKTKTKTKTKTIRAVILDFVAFNNGVLFGFCEYKAGRPFNWKSKNHAVWTPETKKTGILFGGTAAYEKMIGDMADGHYESFIREMSRDAEEALLHGAAPVEKQLGTFRYETEEK